MTGETVTVAGELSTFGAAPRAVDVLGAPLSLGRRLARAAAVTAICWAGACFAVFIPGVHFVAVPSLFVLGVILGARRLRDVMTVERVRGACPRCGAALDLPLSSRWIRRQLIDCPVCHANLTLTIPTALAER
jgi:hypothetical protein